ncbi:hypothetical protein FHS29_000214 [Saccharothrix tamanrassetensis]|uniref:Uncharacterized protein n=1 Tax=Saccharothrix tamanrassetensis TaxID=1051531 RepID=A0A841CBB7_9PSEU|nr:hypothetical protein [Saccharothrix tamanrassetensis]MBB5953644.1 hypothetical protein [Saccharothrix tamanrassetensis]
MAERSCPRESAGDVSNTRLRRVADLPLHESAAALIAPDRSVVVGELLARLAEADGVAGARGRQLPVCHRAGSALAGVHGRQRRRPTEADRLAEIAVRPEHLVLGLIKAVGGPVERRHAGWDSGWT